MVAADCGKTHRGTQHDETRAPRRPSAQAAIADTPLGRHPPPSRSAYSRERSTSSPPPPLVLIGHAASLTPY
jgi:hypothetical protein